MKCPICDRKTQNGATYCQQHQRELALLKAEKRRSKHSAFKYIVYRGHVVGLFKHDGKLVPSYVGMSTSGIPKSKLIDLDHYVNGYTREQVKTFKATVLRLSGT